jgi:hypothetical protein
MAHFAEIDSNNIVIRVLVIDDSQELRGHDFLSNDLKLGGNWIKTSYNTRGNIHLKGGTPFRKNYAGKGYVYDSIRDAFIPPKPFSSWSLNEDTCLWQPPISYPTDSTKRYKWDESIMNWMEIQETKLPTI